jgi:multidrug efflux pump subunit AcrB
MKRILETFVKYPFYANLIVFVIVTTGTVSFLNMKKSFFPERESRQLSVSVSYPGASPKEMDEGITTRIEEAIRGLVGIKEFNSTSSENSSRVDIETTGEYDLDETLQEVKNAVDGISSFPTAAEKPIVSKRRSTSPAMVLGISGEVDLQTLKKYAQTIEDDFLASGVISQVSIGGYPALEISVDISEENLLRYNLTFDEVSRAISQNNRDVSGGMIRSPEEEILIRSRARSVDPDVIGDIILRADDDGRFIRIRDVAEVKMKFAETSSGTWMNGERSLRISVQKLPEEDLDAISQYITAYVDEFNATHEGVTIYTTFDFLEVLKSRINLLYRNGGIGLALILVTLGLFLSVRLSFWVAFGIPASFLAMFLIAVLSGVTINMISLFGMILVIGILVDDGIVIAENIFTHFEAGKSPKRAAVDGTLEVFPAVLTSVATTIVAFLPLFFVSGRMEFMYQMAFVVVMSLGFSLFEAFLVLPAHVGSRHVLKRRDPSHPVSGFRRKLADFIEYLRHGLYGKLLKIILRWKWAVLATPISIIMITVGMYQGGIIQRTFFPSIPFDSFAVEIAFTPGTGEDKTLSYLHRFEAAIWEVNEDLVAEYDQDRAFIDYTFLSLGSAMSGDERGAHAGGVSVMLRDMEDSPISSFEIADRVRKKIGHVDEAEKFTIGALSRWGRPVSISLLGRNLEELDQAKEFLLAGLNEIPELVDITDTNAIGKREVRLKLKPAAYFLGLNHTTISNQVRQGFFGGQSQRLQHGKDELRVWVRYPRSDRMTLGQLENMKIKTPRGEYPLTEMVTYDIERGPVNIPRYNGSREARVEAELADPYAPVPPVIAEINRTIMPVIAANYPGVTVLYQGQQKHSTEAMAEILTLFGSAFIVMILILMVHFKSFLQPLIVIAMIPLAILGAAWGHGLEGIPVSILSMWGMVALSGVVINDAVVFLSKYNSNLVEGQTVYDAVYNAGVSRFRAILLTTITTVAGLYPIVLEKSFQAQFIKPMAVSLAYGVAVGTTCILLFFPVYILVLNDIKVWVVWLITRKRPTPESVENAVINARITLD